MKLLSKSNIKLLKGEQYKYLSYGLSLAPHNLSGYNVCPNSTEGCRASCIFMSGNGFYPIVWQTRIKRTKYYFSERKLFAAQLIKEISLAVKLAKRKGMKLCIRLNVFSDIAFELSLPDIFTKFPDVQFYDYTKNVRRMKKFLNKQFPKNYHLTFSRSESNSSEVDEVISLGGNVAIPFYLNKDVTKLPNFFLGIKVSDGDKSDLRFRDKKNVIVGLKAKGVGRTNTSGFIVRNFI